MNTVNLKYIAITRIKSKWYDDIISEWKPNQEYINYIKNKILKNEFIPAILLVQNNNCFYIINGHHRFYAHIQSNKKSIKSIIIDGNFDDTEPLRKAEVLLKKYDQKTNYNYQFSGYLDRWAATVENNVFINQFTPRVNLNLSKKIKNIVLYIKRIIL